MIGGAGTIGSAICRELFARDPQVLHVVDISENIIHLNHKETGKFLDSRM